MFGDINRIRALATKYSKQELASLVRNRQLPLQDAALAGMMIDRIAKSAMAAPQTTVADDILGAAPTAAQGQIPQMAQQMPQEAAPAMAAHGGLMGMMPHSDGVTALHSGLHDMAGGGIVAFADGGDVPSFAGDKGSYVDENLFKSVIAAESRGNPNAVSPKGARGLAQLMPGTSRDPGFGVQAARDESPEENKRVGKDYLNAMLKRYGNMDYALAAYNWGPGNVDKWIARGAKPEELPAETRDYIPKVKAGMAQMQAKTPVPGRDMLSGVESLLPSAQAADTTPAASQDTSSPIGRVISSALSGPAGARERYDAQQRNLQQQREKAAQLFELGGGGFKQQTPEERAKYEQTQKEINDLRSLPAITPPAAKPAAAKPVTMGPNPLKPEAAPAPAEKAEMGPPVPTALDQLGNFQGAQMEVPGKKTLKDVMGEQEAADKAYGVDTGKMFDDLRQDYAKSGGDLKQRADKAAGMAFMMFGLGLAGARKGQEWQTASHAGQQALGMYMNSMDKINDNEDKLKQRLQDLRIAENQFKTSRSDKALAAVQANRHEIQAIELENAKLKNQSMIKGAEFTVDIFKNENPAQYTVLKNIARDSGKTPAEIFMIANGIAKTGGITLNQAIEAVQKNPKYMNKSFAEQMQIAKEGIGESGGGGSSQLNVGQVVDGYRFKGGDPKNQSNWEKVK